MGLKQAELADLFGGDAAGGEVGNAARLELNADVGDVDLAREDGQADGADLADGRIGEREDDVEVVDHEVEHDIDVERARGKDAEAVRLEEHRFVESGERCGDGGVEALEVADLDDALVLRGEREDVIGLGECCGEGLFDEDIDAGEQQGLRSDGVLSGGHADGGRVETECSSVEFVCRSEGGDAVLRTELQATLCIGIDKSDELHQFGVRGLKFAVDAKVVAPEGARTDDGNA